MEKKIRDTTVAEAIFEVLESAKKPLSGREIFECLPVERMVKNVSYREFWQHFSMMKRRKRQPILKAECPSGEQPARCWCYTVKKG